MDTNEHAIHVVPAMDLTGFVMLLVAAWRLA
jgi:hypothetical protein